MALYSDLLAKASIASIPKFNGAQAIDKLHAALKCAKQTTFLVKLSVELGIQEMIGEIWDIVTPYVSNNAALANISSLIYGAGKDAFPEGTTVRFDCMSDGEVKFGVDGDKVGSVSGESDAFLNAFLGDASVFPSLHLSVVENCCKEDESDSGEAGKANVAGGQINVVIKEANNKAHFDAVRKFQHTVRYLGQSNEQIGEKAQECQRLAVGILYEDSMSGTGWVSL